MNDALTWVKSNIDPRSFLHGLAAVAAFYLLVLLYILWQSGSTIQALEDRLYSKTILIAQDERPGIPEDHADSAESAEETGIPPPPLPPAAEKTGPRALPPAPIEGLFEKTPDGQLPKIRSRDHLTPFQAYRRPFAAPPGKKLIALALADYGLSESLSRAALETLPPEVSVILSSYSPAPVEWQEKARESGRELWLSVPVQTLRYPLDDSGPKTILANAGLGANLDSLHWAMSRTPGYAGIAAYTDAAFEQARPVLQTLVKRALERGVGYMELNAENTGHMLEMVAAGLKAPYIRVQLLLNEDDPEQTASPLKAIEHMARERGYAIGVITPHPAGLDNIRTWIDTLPAKGFALAPVSAIHSLQQGSKAGAP